MFFGERTEASCLTFQPQVAVDAFKETTCLSIGSGRFLRTVFVPAMRALGEQVIVAQTRGSSFGKYFSTRNGSYEVDVVGLDGEVNTEEVTIAGVGTLGKPDGRRSFMNLPHKLLNLRYIGVGVTEAGVCHNGQAMKDLAELLHSCFLAKETWVKASPTNRISIINTDNLVLNGDLIHNFVHGCDYTQGLSDRAGFVDFLNGNVVFHNSMVDRIVSQRKGCPEVPRTEPLPGKAIVIEDLDSVLPPEFAAVPGIVVREEVGRLGLDIALKLRVANCAHSSMVYLMALSRMPMTDLCIDHEHVLPYLDQMFFNDIVWMSKELGTVYEWNAPTVTRTSVLHTSVLHTSAVCSLLPSPLAPLSRSRPRPRTRTRTRTRPTLPTPHTPLFLAPRM
jgi:mannitol-1-phosphate/altronate dehydrogenase